MLKNFALGEVIPFDEHILLPHTQEVGFRGCGQGVFTFDEHIFQTSCSHQLDIGRERFWSTWRIIPVSKFLNNHG